MSRCSHLTLALLLAACGSSDSSTEWAPGAAPVVVVQFNVAGGVALAGDATGADNIAALLRERAPDFIALQECEPCEALLTRLGERYRLSEEPRAGIAIAYDSQTWELRDTNALLLGDNDDGWGQRYALGASFVDRAGGRPLEFYSTHWCVSVRTDDDRCDAQRHVEYAQAIIDELSDAPTVVAGDFNVFDGFESSPAIDHLLQNDVRPLTDVFRAVVPDGDATTFEGNSFAPAGRIDYIFANRPMAISEASLQWAAEPGSDHAAVSAELLF